MAPDQLGRLSSSGPVPATASRPGGPGRGLAQGQAPELSGGALICRARYSRQTSDRERRESAFRAKILRQQHGQCAVCRQVIQSEEDLELHHRDGNHQENRLTNLVLLHPNCHRQVHYAPDSKTATSRPARGVDHA
jgi:hypothetical protein